jgi:prepilin-type N-terminal cleavage/methylation domain-containing protein
MVLSAAPARGLVRSGFTLLEVLLSSAVGVLLMGALYVAVDVQLGHAKVAREVVEQSTLARAVLTRIAGDISCSLAPTPPPATSSGGGGGMGGGGAMGGGGSANGSGTGQGATSSTTNSTTNSGGTGSNAGASSTSGTNSSNGTSSSSNAVVVNYGVQGTNQQMTLSVSRLPRNPTQGTDQANNLANGDPTGVSDLRLITYWLAGGGDAPLGLARLELTQVTSSDATNLLPPNIPDDATHVIAEEVRSLNFRYFDGSAWQDSWDGTQLGSDGVTPLGPPQAIEITIGVAAPGAALGSDGQPILKSYRHVVAIPTANGTTTPTTTSTTGQ